MIPITPTRFQARVLQIPESFNVAMLGGRGGGKSMGMAMLILRHCAKYGADARPLVIRETYKGLEAMAELLVSLLEQAFPGRVKYNRQEHICRVEGGAIVEFGQLSDPNDIKKFLGRNFTILAIDEAGLLKDWKIVTMLKSTLRSGNPDVKLQTIFTGNPAGAQHAFLHRTFISPAVAWNPFRVEGEVFVTAPSTYRDNPHIDAADYRAKILAACGNDAELARAWLDNDWNVNKGAYFPELDEKIHMIAQAKVPEITSAWHPYMSLDFGQSAPCIVSFGGTCPGDVPGIPRGTVVMFDEISTHNPTDLSMQTGSNWAPDKLADAITEVCGRWNMARNGVADDAMGYTPNDSLITFFRNQHQINFVRPNKGRLQGWSLLRNRLVATKEQRPNGILFSDRLEYFWKTVPFLIRDPRRPEDMASDGPDHSADTIRYWLTTPVVTRVSGRVSNW